MVHSSPVLQQPRSLYGARDGQVFQLLWAAKERQRLSLWRPPDNMAPYILVYRSPVSFAACEQRTLGALVHRQEDELAEPAINNDGGSALELSRCRLS